ncbi:MAG: hypothetical protein HFF39_01715 [Lawsonibacter sp.]|nr:hypothetical protein [Lawsonibacter sp.]
MELQQLQYFRRMAMPQNMNRSAQALHIFEEGRRGRKARAEKGKDPLRRSGAE